MTNGFFVEHIFSPCFLSMFFLSGKLMLKHVDILMKSTTALKLTIFIK